VSTFITGACGFVGMAAEGAAPRTAHAASPVHV
jgi:hypothetical protein